MEDRKIPNDKQTKTIELPDIYESYLTFIKTYRELQPTTISSIRRVLTAFYIFTQENSISLSHLKIEHIDAFILSYNFKYGPAAQNKNCTCLRGFLGYLYNDRGILKRDLAVFVRGAVRWTNARPPKFFRPEEIKQLFSYLNDNSDTRISAIIYIAFTLGLRPIEINLLDLDHIQFSRGEMTLVRRKNGQPIKLPIPEETLKAMALYIIGDRPTTDQRALFVQHTRPYERISQSSLSRMINTCIRKAGLNGSAYWLRHTYAKNLLEAESTIYEIKEMMGHEQIQTTHRYLNIHHSLMRKVLFDETF